MTDPVEDLKNSAKSGADKLAAAARDTIGFLTIWFRRARLAYIILSLAGIVVAIFYFHSMRMKIRAADQEIKKYKEAEKVLLSSLAERAKVETKIEYRILTNTIASEKATAEINEIKSNYAGVSNWLDAVDLYRAGR